MGFLDHSTNNIIVDAVLTDAGRKALADGTFNITQFSLGDDEVDYTIIQKFGRTVGKEKIIKNTPVFEAQTVGSLGIKHRLMTLEDPTVINLPVVSLSGDVTDGKVTINQSSSTTSETQAQITLKEEVVGVVNPTSVIPQDTEFFVEIPHRFLQLLDSTGASISTSSSRIEKGTNIALYTLARTNSSGMPELTFTIRGQALDDTMFNTFGTTAAKDRIDCVVSVTGRSTGLRSTINVIINK